MKDFLYLVTLLILVSISRNATAQSDTLKIGVAGSAPFVISENNANKGVSVEIWEEIAEDLNISYTYNYFDDVVFHKIKKKLNCKIKYCFVIYNQIGK